MENTYIDLQLKRFITTATGYTLDLIGDIVGDLRDFRNDDYYRTSIFTKGVTNNGGGTPEDIISAIRILYKTRKIEYTELHPSYFSLFIHVYEAINPDDKQRLTNIRSLVRSIAPAGVDFSIIKGVTENLFRFSESTSEVVDFMVNSNGEQNLKINQTTGESKFLVEADTVSASLGSFGFGELITATGQVVGGGTLSEEIRRG